MVRAPCFDKNGIKKGAWSLEEDNKLRAYITIHGHSNWRELPKLAGLSRCGKSCRLRWMNYLRPNMKRGKFSKQEEDVIVGLHKKFGNKWSMMAAQLPGRSDNEIKNHWHTHLKNRNEKYQSHVSKTNKQVDQPVKANSTAGGDCEQVKEPNLKSQPEVDILLAVLSSELPSASASESSSSSSSSTSTSGDQVSECSLSVSDYGVACDDYFTPQFSEMSENLWFEEFLDNSLISNTNSLQDQIMDDVPLWSTMDLYY